MNNMSSNEVITAQDKQMRLPWWGVLCVILGTVLIGSLFLHFGRFDLAPPSLISLAMLSVAIALRWQLKRHVWFWVIMIFLAALHVPLILFIPWTTNWVPAFEIVPFALADLCAMLWTISVVRKFMAQKSLRNDVPVATK